MDSLVTIVISTPSATSSGWLQWLTALGPLVVGIVVAQIALRQWLTARNKLKLDLFDRRVRLYDEISAIRNKLQKAYVASAPVKMREFDADKFIATFKDAKWLFGDDVQSLIINEVGHACLEFISARDLVDANIGRARDHESEETDAEKERLRRAYFDLDTKISAVLTTIRPYLKLSH